MRKLSQVPNASNRVPCFHFTGHAATPRSPRRLPARLQQYVQRRRPSRAHEPKVMQAAAGLVRACHSSVGGWVVHYESESCRHTHAGPALTEYSVPREIPLDCPLWPKLPAPHRVQGAGAHLRQGRPHVSRAPPSPSIQRRTDKECPFSRCSICSWSLDAQTKNGVRLPIPVPAPNTIPPSSTIHTTPSTPARRGFDRPSTPRPSIFCPVHNPLHPGRCLCPPPPR